MLACTLLALLPDVSTSGTHHGWHAGLHPQFGRAAWVLPDPLTGGGFLVLVCRGPSMVLILDRVPEVGPPRIEITIDDRIFVLRSHAGKAPGTAETRPGAPLVAALRHGTRMRVQRPGRLPMLLSLHGSDAAIYLAVTPCLPRPGPRVDASDAETAMRA